MNTQLGRGTRTSQILMKVDTPLIGAVEMFVRLRRMFFRKRAIPLQQLLMDSVEILTIFSSQLLELCIDFIQP